MPMPNANPWIMRPGGGMVRNPDYVPPIANGWQQMTAPGNTGGLVRPGVNQPASIPQTQQQAPNNPGAPGNVGQYNIGIQSGHLPDSLIEQASSTLRAPVASPAFPNVTPEQQQGLSGQFQDSMRAGTMASDIDLRRGAAADQADLNLRRQMAMASAGLGGGNLLARLNETNLAGQAPFNSMLLNLLMGSV